MKRNEDSWPNRPFHRRLVSAACLSILALSPLFRAQAATEQMVGPEVYEALKTSTPVRVVVGFRTLLAPLADLEFRKTENQHILDRLLSRLDPSDFNLMYRFEYIGGMGGELTESGLSKLLADPDVLGVALDGRVSVSLARSVPMVHAEDMHAHGSTGSGVGVVVIDTGIDRAHPDLIAPLNHEECFCGNSCCPNKTSRQSGPGSAQDDNGHGTHVSGIISAQGIVSAVGMAPGASLDEIKVLDSNGRGADTDVLMGLQWIVANSATYGIRVANLSLGSNLSSGIPYPGNKACDNANVITMMYASVIHSLKSLALPVAVFAASGNDGNNNGISAPACVSNAISVGAVYSQDMGQFGRDATTAPDKVTYFSNTGAILHLMAPGCPITSTHWGGGMTTECGTSQAAPHAAGAAALLLQTNLSLTPDQIEVKLRAPGYTVADPKGRSFSRIDLTFSPELVFESSRSGRFQIWEVQTHPPGAAAQVTTAGGGNQEARSGDWAVAADRQYIGNLSQPTLGRIVYQFGAPGVRGLHLTKSDGLGDVQLLHMSSDDRDPAWSPDGRFIAFASLPSGGASYSIWIYDTNGTPDDTRDDREYALLSGPGNLNLRPAWSPDFNTIAFVAAGGAVGSTAQIVSVPVTFNSSSGMIIPNGSVKILTSGGFTHFDPTWSPDSKYVAYSTTQNGNKDIYKMLAADGSNQQQLTTSSANDSDPAWSPNGRLVAFVSDRTGKNQIYTLDPLLPESPTSPPKLISDGTSDDEAPAWRIPRTWFTVGTYPSRVLLFPPYQTQQFRLFVTGTPNAAVNWSVNPLVGTVSNTGLYTPPSKISAAANVTVEATSVVDTAKLAGSTIAFSVVKLAPASLSFGSQTVGKTTAPKNAKLTNTSSTSLHVSSISVVGANPGDFKETNTCGASVAAGASCTISVTFKPTAKGARSAFVSVGDSGGNSPQLVSLSGKGT